VHGTAPVIAGKNMANLVTPILSSVMMLQHLRLNEPHIGWSTNLFSKLQMGSGALPPPLITQRQAYLQSLKHLLSATACSQGQFYIKVFQLSVSCHTRIAGQG
jgi:hypothetical protein